MKGNSSAKSDTTSTYFVEIVDDKDGKSNEEIAEMNQLDKNKPQVQRELGLTLENVILKISKPYIHLTMKALGKADLYFHAYFWNTYLKSLGKDSKIDAPFMKRLTGLSSTLSKVIINIRKFPFNEAMYQKYVNEFGQRNIQKKNKYLEEI